MTDTQEFQKAHGADYVKTIKRPDLQAALLLIDTEKLNSLLALTPIEIKENGSVILAELIGHLKHQNALLTLHERRTFDPAELPPETYEGEEEPAATSSSKRKKKTT